MNKRRKIYLLVTIIIAIIIGICIVIIIISNINKQQEQIVQSNVIKGIVISKDENYKQKNILSERDVGIQINKGIATQIIETLIETKEATAIHSYGNIKLEDSYIRAENAPAIILENTGTVILDGVEVISAENENQQIDNMAMVICNSDNSLENCGNFTSINSILTLDSQSEKFTTNPMFLIENCKTDINLENTIIMKKGNILLKVQGENALVTINAKKQNLEGDIELDDAGIININLSDETNFIGSVNKNNIAREVNINITENSLLMLTSDIYVTTIMTENNNLDNIMSEGNNIYYDETNEKNAWLEGKIILLNGGGYLIPRQ